MLTSIPLLYLNFQTGSPEVSSAVGSSGNVSVSGLSMTALLSGLCSSTRPHALLSTNIHCKGYSASPSSEAPPPMSACAPTNQACIRDLPPGTAVDVVSKSSGRKWRRSSLSATACLACMIDSLKEISWGTGSLAFFTVSKAPRNWMIGEGRVFVELRVGCQCSASHGSMKKHYR